MFVKEAKSIYLDSQSDSSEDHDVSNLDSEEVNEQINEMVNEEVNEPEEDTVADIPQFTEYIYTYEEVLSTKISSMD